MNEEFEMEFRRIKSLVRDVYEKMRTHRIFLDNEKSQMDKIKKSIKELETKLQKI